MDADRSPKGSRGGNRPLVVAGVDGSVNGLHAAAWAAPHVSQMGAVLWILVAWIPPHPWFVVDNPSNGSARALEHAHRAEQVAFEAAPELAIQTEVIELPPIQALIEASKNADLLVVGRRGLGGLRGLLLGSVSQQGSVALAEHRAWVCQLRRDFTGQSTSASSSNAAAMVLPGSASTPSS